MAHRPTDASAVYPTQTAPSLLAVVFRERENRQGANEVRHGGGRVEEGRSGQERAADARETTRDALSLVPLLSASILHVRNKPQGSSLLCSESARRNGEASGVHAVVGQSRSAGMGSSAQGTTLTRPESCLCSPPPSSASATRAVWDWRSYHPGLRNLGGMIPPRSGAQTLVRRRGPGGVESRRSRVRVKHTAHYFRTGIKFTSSGASRQIFGDRSILKCIR